jgi:hypothetical protein
MQIMENSALDVMLTLLSSLHFSHCMSKAVVQAFASSGEEGLA